MTDPFVTSAETVAVRDDLCGARKRQGEGTCTQPAGWGTSHLGFGKCKLHGGGSPSHVTAALPAQVRALTTRLLHDPDALPITDSIAALQRRAGILVNALETLGAEIDKAGVDSKKIRYLLAAYVQLSRELRQLLVDMKRLGLDERKAQVEEAQARLVLAAFALALDDYDRNRDRDAAIAALVAGMRAQEAIEAERK